MPKGIKGFQKGNKVNLGRHLTEEAKKKCRDVLNQYRPVAPFTGKHHTKITKAKLSDMLRGENNPFYGKTHTAEVKTKISNFHKGKKFSEDHKNKISFAHKNKVFTEEHRRNIGLTHKGKSLSTEHKKKLSESHKLYYSILANRIKAGLSHKGSLSSTWKGGITPITRLVRNSIRYIEWRQQVLIRDNFTCQKCGKRGGDLEAHHKKAFSILFNEARNYMPLFPLYDAAMAYLPLWDIDNGMTLCERCHPRSLK